MPSTTWFLGSPGFTSLPQTAELTHRCMRATHTNIHTDHGTRDVCSNRPRLCDACHVANASTRVFNLQPSAGPDLLQVGSLFRNKCGAPSIRIPHNPPPDCLHPTLSSPTRTVVIIDYFWLVTMLQKMGKKLSFCGAPFLWGPCSAEHAEHA